MLMPEGGKGKFSVFEFLPLEFPYLHAEISSRGNTVSVYYYLLIN
jgi:hypothetical protein